MGPLCTQWSNGIERRMTGICLLQGILFGEGWGNVTQARVASEVLFKQVFRFMLPSYHTQNRSHTTGLDW